MSSFGFPPSTSSSSGFTPAPPRLESGYLSKIIGHSSPTAVWKDVDVKANMKTDQEKIGYFDYPDPNIFWQWTDAVSHWSLSKAAKAASHGFFIKPVRGSSGERSLLSASGVWNSSADIVSVEDLQKASEQSEKGFETRKAIAKKRLNLIEKFSGPYVVYFDAIPYSDIVKVLGEFPRRDNNGRATSQMWPGVDRSNFNDWDVLLKKASNGDVLPVRISMPGPDYQEIKTNPNYPDVLYTADFMKIAFNLHNILPNRYEMVNTDPAPYAPLFGIPSSVNLSDHQSYWKDYNIAWNEVYQQVVGQYGYHEWEVTNLSNRNDPKFRKFYEEIAALEIDGELRTVKEDDQIQAGLTFFIQTSAKRFDNKLTVTIDGNEVAKNGQRVGTAALHVTRALLKIADIVQSQGGLTLSRKMDQKNKYVLVDRYIDWSAVAIGSADNIEAAGSAVVDRMFKPKGSRKADSRSAPVPGFMGTLRFENPSTGVVEPHDVYVPAGYLRVSPFRKAEVKGGKTHKAAGGQDALDHALTELSVDDTTKGNIKASLQGPLDLIAAKLASKTKTTSKVPAVYLPSMGNEAPLTESFDLASFLQTRGQTQAPNIPMPSSSFN